MIRRHAGIYNLHLHVIKVCVRALRFIMLMIGVFVAGCAVIPDSTTPRLDQEFGKSVQLNKDLQRIPVDPNKTQSSATLNSREVRVYVDNYIRGAMTTGNALDAPITTGGGK